MPKLPRTDVIEGNLEVVRETFDTVDDELLEDLRGGQIQARYGLVIPKRPVEQPGEPTPSPTVPDPITSPVD